MTATFPFSGYVLADSRCHLGEGPSYEQETDTIWWFDILGETLHSLELSTGSHGEHPLGVKGSVFARIDEARQLIASDAGLMIRDRASGALSLHVALEAGKPGNRSNDGRVHPSGALWIGTMGRKAEQGAGSIYHVAGSTVTTLFTDISITNAICFSPDGATGYYVDTRENRLMSVPLDPATGLPTGKPTLLVDTKGEPGGMDGAVCDQQGNLWNARWGGGAIDVYTPEGQRVGRHLMPVPQPSCPVFYGRDLSAIAATTAREGLDEAALAEAPQSGALIALGARVPAHKTHA